MPSAARRNFEAGIQLFQSRLAEVLAAAEIAESETLAPAMLAQMVGAITLARTMQNETAALAFIAAVRADLKQRLGLDR